MLAPLWHYFSLEALGTKCQGDWVHLRNDFTLCESPLCILPGFNPADVVLIMETRIITRFQSRSYTGPHRDLYLRVEPDFEGPGTYLTVSSGGGALHSGQRNLIVLTSRCVCWSFEVKTELRPYLALRDSHIGIRVWEKLLGSVF